jgi:hypothetical protein
MHANETATIEGLLDIYELSDLLQVSPEVITDWAKRGVIPYYLVPPGDVLRFSWTDVRLYLAKYIKLHHESAKSARGRGITHFVHKPGDTDEKRSRSTSLRRSERWEMDFFWSPESMLGSKRVRIRQSDIGRSSQRQRRERL